MAILTHNAASSRTATAREITWFPRYGAPFLEEKIRTRLNRAVDAAWSCRTMPTSIEAHALRPSEEEEVLVWDLRRREEARDI